MASILFTIKIAFILLAVGLIIFVISFASPYWTDREIHERPDPSQRAGARKTYVDGHINYGLWTYCWNTEEYLDERTKRGLVIIDDCWNLVSNPFWLNDETRVSQFFETIGLLSVITSLVLLLINVLVGACKDRSILYILSAVFCLAGAGSIILGTIIFGTTEQHRHYLSWAFVLAVVGGLIFSAAGIFIIIGGILMK